MSAEIFAEGIREILRLRGLAFLDDPRKLEGLFRDLWPERRRETNILLAALREKIPQEISQAAIVSQLTLYAWCDRLADLTGLTDEAARWAVWVWASGVNAKMPPDFLVILPVASKPQISVGIDALYAIEYEKAQALFKAGDWDAAVERLEIVLRLKESAPATFMLGRCFCENKNYGEAARLFRRAIAMDGSDVAPMNWLAWLMHYVSHDYLEAERMYSRSLHLDADQFYPSYRLGLLLFEVRKDYVQAEKLFRIATQLRPCDADAISALAWLLYSIRKEVDEAERLFLRALDLNPNCAHALNCLGIVKHHTRKKFAEAEPLYRKAMALDPNWAHPVNNLAALMFEVRHDYDQAEALYRKAVELEPNEGLNLANLAGTLVRLNRLHEAAFFARQAKAMGHTDHWVYKPLGL